MPASPPPAHRAHPVPKLLLPSANSLPLLPPEGRSQDFFPDWFCKSVFRHNPVSRIIIYSRLSSASATLDNRGRITREGEENKCEAFLYTQCFPSDQLFSACFKKWRVLRALGRETAPVPTVLPVESKVRNEEHSFQGATFYCVTKKTRF